MDQFKRLQQSPFPLHAGGQTVAQYVAFGFKFLDPGILGSALPPVTMRAAIVTVNSWLIDRQVFFLSMGTSLAPYSFNHFAPSF
jgi:hypothetical protein